VKGPKPKAKNKRTKKLKEAKEENKGKKLKNKI